MINNTAPPFDPMKPFRQGIGPQKILEEQWRKAQAQEDHAEGKSDSDILDRISQVENKLEKIVSVLKIIASRMDAANKSEDDKDYSTESRLKDGPKGKRFIIED